jgi:septum formation protein
VNNRDGKRFFVHLASASPRRRELLSQLGVDFDVVPARVDESPRPGEEAPHYVRRVALDKGRTARAMRDGHAAPLLAADTAVVVDGDVLGKPRDREDAANMLARLSGREHEVLTAVAVLAATREEIALNCTAVRFRPLDADEIDAYWRSGEPVGKAGGYAIQGLAAVFIAEIRGSYSGVMGLPLFETARLLSAFGYRLPARAAAR